MKRASIPEWRRCGWCGGDAYPSFMKCAATLGREACLSCWAQIARIHLFLATVTFAATGVACGGDTFTIVFAEGGPDPADAGAIDAAAHEEAEASRSDVDASEASTLDASPDVKDAIAPDSNPCTYNGPSECGAAVGAYCTTYQTCCGQFPGQGACASWGASSQLCKTHWNGSGFDCGSQKFSPNVCTQATACKNEITSGSCSSIFSSSGPASSNFPSCPAFWSQF